MRSTAGTGGGGSESLELAGDGTLEDIVADADAEAGDESGVLGGGRGDRPVVDLGEIGDDPGYGTAGERTGELDLGMAAAVFADDEAAVLAQDGGGVGRSLLFEPNEDVADLGLRELASLHAEIEHELGGGAGLFGCGHRYAGAKSEGRVQNEEVNEGERRGAVRRASSACSVPGSSGVRRR